MTTRPPRVEVYWRDIVSDSRWASLDDVRTREPVACTTLGYLIRDTADTVTLSHTLSGDDGDYTTIPRGCITRVVRLRSGKASA